MPRVTRAALRTQELQEESEIAASTPLPPTPTKKRVPLGEISDNIATEVQAAELQEKMAPLKKGPGRSKKANAAKKGSKQRKAKDTETQVEILEDGNASETSSAVEEACQDLLKDSPNTNQVALDSQRPSTPASAAVNTATQQLSPKCSKSRFNAEIHKPEEATTSDARLDKEDSFVENIESRSPAKMTSEEEMDTQSLNNINKGDPFIEHIKSRSPGKRVSRIEDSVEALDVLEEEIEKVDKEIPTATDNLQEPTKTKKLAKAQPKPAERQIGGSMRINNTSTTLARDVTKKPFLSVRATAPRPSILPAAKAFGTPRSRAKLGVTTNSPVPARESVKAGPSAARRKRVSSVHKAPFQPVKSTKPPTQSKFELPGEAISRKLKEQREERQKREEEDKSKQRAFKARPVRLSQAPEVKLTAATKARLDLAKGEPVNSIKAVVGTPKPKPFTRPASTVSVGVNKRVSPLSVAKRTSSVQPAANSSERHSRNPSLSNPTTTRNISTSDAPRTAPTAEDLAQQKVKGKETFKRTKADIAEREKTRKEKEEAAKKARAEAAERGRVASREWAEKQKQKKLEAQKANGDAKAVAT
ncbi:hypothetical protein N7G274_004784 [Stereocaulon virgatum]|uniref:HTH Mu-type domain-containing protein n=1 Tax=Stereocaulon virgatum TaxID=373712 RepID=A0ABR4AA13_9LECA